MACAEIRSNQIAGNGIKSKNNFPLNFIFEQKVVSEMDPVKHLPYSGVTHMRLTMAGFCGRVNSIKTNEISIIKLIYTSCLHE